MDDALFTLHYGPVASVQLIPIINYLNLLSDFLLIENYLTEFNQNKQIPIVNALYEYLEEYRNDDSGKMKLIRKLLQGSDLYGAQDNEELNAVFVNTMFDHIISSLVFDKYGNIYGFLAEVVQRTANLQHNHVLMVAKETLRNATFENEYGANSVLTHLAVDRLHNDLILPLFPQPNANLSLLSLDYIFAQAGSMYLRLGKINDTYFPGNENTDALKNTVENNFFNECLAIGHVLKKLIHTGKIDSLTLRVFALPALFYYVSSDNRVRNEAITNIIFSPHHWKKAYRDFFEHLDNAFERIENQLMKDYNYKIHLAFSHFQSLAAMANFVLDLECQFLNKPYRDTRIPVYIEHAEHFECQNGFVLPNIKDWFQDQIHNVGEIYGEYDLEMTKQSFSKFSIEDLRNVTITLLFTKDRVTEGEINSSQYLSYDLLEFYYPKNKTSEFYALIRQNYTVRLIKESDDPELFRKKISISLKELIQSGHRTVLKNANQGPQEFTAELVKHKKERFKSYLHFGEDSLKTNEWWKEFGLSLVPSYPCLLKITNHDDIKNNLCEKNTVKFVNQFKDDITTQLIHNDTQSLLSSLGTTIKTIFLKDSIDAIIHAHGNFSLSSQMINSPRNLNEHTMDAVYDSFSLEIEKPAFTSFSTKKNDVNLVSTILEDIQKNVNYNFTFLGNILDQMKILKTFFMKSLGSIGERKNQLLFVNVGKNDTGYGYKFITIGSSNGTVVNAQLRTGYEFKDRIIITPIIHSSENNNATNSSNDEKIYVKLNNANFETESHFIYEVNNQLRKKSTRVLFSGVSTYYKNNDKCDDYEYFQDKENRKNCMRHLRFIVKTTIYEEEAVKSLRRRGILKRNDFTSENHVRNILKMYTFKSDASFFFFIENWLINSNFENSDWTTKNIIDKSGLLKKLMYDVHLGKCNLSLFDGKSRIDSIYTYRERKTIEDGTSLENIIQDYNEQKACYSVTFEDYYAIRNFATTGDRRITGDTTEAKLMKIALNKLAARQFEDLGEGFELKLFRFYSKPEDFARRQFFFGKRVVLEKFTLTTTSEVSATRFGGYPASECENILYEFNFDGPYFRAKIESKVERFESALEKQIILLPGSEFVISDILTVTNIGGIGNATKVVLTSTFNANEKYEWYKKIMTEITRIRL